MLNVAGKILFEKGDPVDYDIKVYGSFKIMLHYNLTVFHDKRSQTPMISLGLASL